MTHIVIVDDEVDTHMLYKLKFKKLFPQLGPELKLVSFLNAQECLDYMKQAPKVDLILSDINMPEIDGFGLLERLHSMNVKVPIYMVSAYESSDFRDKANTLGATRFLSKPVDFTALGEMLKADLKLPVE